VTLAGLRIGVTAARKAEEQIALLERRGATVEWGPALALDPHRVDDDALLAATRSVLTRPPDVFLATTGIGMRTWFAAAERWGLLPDLLAVLAQSEILARGPKSVGALRARGLRERWAPASEAFDDVLTELLARDLSGLRIVLQEHGQPLASVAEELRRRGASVTVVAVYRVYVAEDPEPLRRLAGLVADRTLDAVTFTSAPAVVALMDAAADLGRLDEVVSGFGGAVVAACVGPVTAAAFEQWDLPTIHPNRSRLAAMVHRLERELSPRTADRTLAVRGCELSFRSGRVLVDGREVVVSPGPGAVLEALVARPGHVVTRAELMSALPTGEARSEHAVEVAVARLRASVGSSLVETVVKRGYRLAVTKENPSGAG
jgi:uroporphyrinogen-III synthase